MKDWQDHCYLLHRRPYKDYYSWIWLLTREHGVVSACIRETKKSRKGLEPLVTFAGYWCCGRESQVLKINQIELAQKAYNLSGIAAVSGLYINELIYSTCQNTELSLLFQAYGTLLEKLLSGGQQLLIALREFELLLLQDLGYEISLKTALASNYNHFQYSSDMGLIGTAAATSSSFDRDVLQAIAEKNWQFPGALSSAKRLNKTAIAHILNGKVLQCYSWFQES